MPAGLFGFGVLATFLAILMYREFRPEPQQLTAEDIEAAVALALEDAPAPPAFSAQVYQMILPSFVVVQTEEHSDGEEDHDGLGSGVIIDSNARVLTALHVVENADEITITFSDGTRSPALIGAEQPENDIAVLVPGVMPTEFLPATIGSLRSMRIGDEVYAVGNPLGLAGSMSSGVVSGFERGFTPTGSDQRIGGLVQFDAAVNPGNSGGPLLNRSGHVVGIVVGLVNPTEESFFIGIGFAVPINVAAGAAGGPEQ